jgi:hypothetical protein
MPESKNIAGLAWSGAAADAGRRLGNQFADTGFGRAHENFAKAAPYVGGAAAGLTTAGVYYR